VRGQAATAGSALAVLALVAACSSHSGRTSGLGQPVTPPAGSAAPSAPPGSAPATGTTGSPTAAPKPSTPATTLPKPVHGPAGRPCTTADLRVIRGVEQGAAGTSVTSFTILNRASGSCEMEGWPFVAPYGPLKQGGSTVEADLGIPVGHITTADGGPVLGATGGLIGLAPGDTAVFYLRWSRVPAGSGDKCPQADGFDFRPPLDPSTDDNLLVAYSFAPCGDTLEISQVLLPS
jgi:hypothetical protein